MKQIVAGILAHVDAGKTTLSESLMYECKEIRAPGRVDRGDAFLDTHELEKSRGITIFSKQAVFTYEDMKVTLLDTPGHVDFSAEMERTLQILDYGILVINGADGVQPHTLTLWKLLEKYCIPVFLFINKMDQLGTDQEWLIRELKDRLNNNCVDFLARREAFLENAAVCDDAVLEHFLETGKLETTQLSGMVKGRRIFPCYFGSALKQEGVKELLMGLLSYTEGGRYLDRFGAKVFKITRDEQGSRLTHLKITGGSLRVKDILENADGNREEKVNQIRIYSGAKYEAVGEAAAGMVCAVTGPLYTQPGQGFGMESQAMPPSLVSVLTYRMILPEGCDNNVMLTQLKKLEEEQPELHILWNEALREIQVQIMGQVQLEILKSLISKRFLIDVEFGAGSILYRETITKAVVGAGHFEPLRHYAEVHLLMEPGEPGSGLVTATCCSEDKLDRNWQRLIITHIKEKEHAGVLTGAPITDMKITLIAGRAHKKHTEGGDFRQATYRAIRQGLMQAESVLLEPFYSFWLETPEKMAGRAMADLERMHGKFTAPEFRNGLACLEGTVPAAAVMDYPEEVKVYTGGAGSFSCSFWGYGSCHNAGEVIEAAGYDPLEDGENPPGSIFCSHGAGYYVEWDKAKESMHLDIGAAAVGGEEAPDARQEEAASQLLEPEQRFIGEDEIDRIYRRTFFANRKEKKEQDKLHRPQKVIAAQYPVCRPKKRADKKKEYLLVDGYNILFSWEELKDLAKTNLDSARGRLLDILCNYQAVRGCSLIAVFDAYLVAGHAEETLDYHNIHVVFTRQAQTADGYIEQFAHEYGKKYDVTVATSDAMEQIIITGQGCRLLTAKELEQEVSRLGRLVQEEYARSQRPVRHFVMDVLAEEQKRQMKEFSDGKKKPEEDSL